MSGTKTVKVVEVEGKQEVELHWAIKPVAIFIILAVLSSVSVVLLGFPSLADDVDDNKKEIKIIKSNQRVLDETVRNVQAEARWTNLKADAIMEELGITKRIKRPKIEKSEMEEIK